ncbi:GTP-binding Obg [Pyrrhoderma noxium]|uniref:GTP-binding Obg n=1 Tax=Pyrrhoderma noxium TaxID=2282107 RepID=A0A286UE97_9AGAM|nr:GTP-binding Obg [Pyrrhoderma noxium]
MLRHVLFFPNCRVASKESKIWLTIRGLSSEAKALEDDQLKSELRKSYQRQRKTEWKRRQRGQTFLDNLIVTVRGGKGGDGCVAFHREKYVPHGPPSGGNGGKGGDVYILPTPGLTTLSSITKRVRGVPGGNGKGTWMNGRNGTPTIIRVPVGTVVRELTGEDSRRAQDEWEAEEESLQNLSPQDRLAKIRNKRWVHYPGAEDNNLERDAFKEAERILITQEREKRMLRREQQTEPLYLDLDSPVTASSAPVHSDLEIRHQAIDGLGYLVASGGEGGLGNPTFLTTENRSPKFATRGTDGQRITLSLELKILADIGLVGYPNAGKSTLLRAMTGGRAKTEVAGYAFTTLNPSVGVVRMDDAGNVLGSGLTDLVIDETRIEEQQFKEKMERGELADALTRNQMHEEPLDEAETFRFTVADNPGLISQASDNVGLGHSFLRSIERSLALVYVVDFSGPNPEQELRVLRDELETYQQGLSAKARLVIANKADLLGTEGGPSVEEAKEKLRKLETFVQTEMASNESPLDIVPISAKYSQNLTRVILLCRKYVEEAKGLLLNSVTRFESLMCGLFLPNSPSRSIYGRQSFDLDNNNTGGSPSFTDGRIKEWGTYLVLQEDSRRGCALDFVRFKADQPINDGDSQARFGIWAACTYRESSSTRICTPTGHGYSVLLVNLISGDIKTLTPSWTRGLAIHPVAAIVTFIATVLSIFPLTSFSLAGTILTFVAAFLALLAFICDIALLAHIKQLLKDAQGYDVSSGPGFWLTFISRKQACSPTNKFFFWS